MEMKEKVAMPLNEIENKRAYAKYYTGQMAKPNPEQMAKLLKGPMDAGLAIYPQEAGKAAGTRIYGRGNRLLHHGKRRWLSGCQQ